MLKKVFKRKISIVFICQWKAGYIKFKDVVDKMIEDEKIDVKLLVFPENIKDFPNNYDLSFWENTFSNIEIINAINNNEWFNLKSIKPDYVFLQRPYDVYLPEEYAFKKISSYSKVSYIPYCYLLSDLHDICLPQNFLENIYFYFAENKEEYLYANEIMKEAPGKHFCENLGYPYLDQEIKMINNNSAFNNIKKDEKKIIWSTRWTTKQEAYGTTFFDYKDKMVDYFKKNKKLKLVFRPHPLMFNNFIDTKLMTKEEVDQFLENMVDNIYYDNNESYLSTFIDSDFLITDYSSIILDYYMLNKPIIICGNNDESKYTKTMKKISKSSYVVKNWGELVENIELLINGVDPKKDQRKKIIKEIIEENDGRVSYKIIKCIKDDFYK